MNVDIVDNKSVGVSAPGLLTPGTRVQMTEMMYRDDGDTDPRAQTCNPCLTLLALNVDCAF